jgi:hypothetical protein
MFGWNPDLLKDVKSGYISELRLTWRGDGHRLWSGTVQNKNGKLSRREQVKFRTYDRFFDKKYPLNTRRSIRSLVSLLNLASLFKAGRNRRVTRCCASLSIILHQSSSGGTLRLFATTTTAQRVDRIPLKDSAILDTLFVNTRIVNLFLLNFCCCLRSWNALKAKPKLSHWRWLCAVENSPTYGCLQCTDLDFENNEAIMNYLL